MAEFPALPVWTDAYLADTSHLSDAEHGRYHMILYAMWRAPECRIPNDDEWLARKFRRSVEEVKSELRPLIVEFCQCDGNWITQKRLLRERAHVQKTSKKQSGRAKSRWEKEKDESRGNATAGNAPTPTPTPTPIPTPIPLKEDPPIAPRKRVACLNADQTKIFEEWYSIYPLHKARLAAERAFLGALARASPAELLAGAARYRDECAGKEARYIAHPATWLNQGRWKDENGRLDGSASLYDISQRRRPTAPPAAEDIADVGG